MKRLFFSLLFLLPVALSAELLGPDQTLTDLEFEDQHGRRHTLSEDLRFLIFSADMDGGKLIHRWMQDRNDEFLARQGIALLADIHRMPFLISKAIALPRMRDYSYSLLLIQEEDRGSIYPHREGSVTILVLNNLAIKSIHHASTVDELQTVLDKNR